MPQACVVNLSGIHRAKQSGSGPTGGVRAGEFPQLQCLQVQLRQGGHGISTDLAPGLWER